jgi:hypothetical protein
MYTIRADTTKNRLYVKFIGFFDYKEMKAATDKTIEEAKKLKPGFDVINDVSDFKPAAQDMLKEIERAQSFLKKAGVRHGVRVEGKAKLSNIQFSRIGKAVDYVAEIVETMEEAEKLLDSYNR